MLREQPYCDSVSQGQNQRAVGMAGSDRQLNQIEYGVSQGVVRALPYAHRHLHGITRSCRSSNRLQQYADDGWRCPAGLAESAVAKFSNSLIDVDAWVNARCA